MHLKGKIPNLKTDVDCFNIDKSLDGQEYKQAIRSHLTVIQSVSIVTVASVLLVAVEAVIVRFVQQTRGRGGQTLDSVRVLGVLVVSLVLLGLGAGVSVCCFNYRWKVTIISSLCVTYYILSHLNIEKLYIFKYLLI